MGAHYRHITPEMAAREAAVAMVGRLVGIPGPHRRLQSLRFAPPESREPVAGGRQPGPADDRRRRQPAAANQEQVEEGVFAGVVGQGVHGQRVWQ
jgi:hypothetical protein